MASQDNQINENDEILTVNKLTVPVFLVAYRNSLYKSQTEIGKEYGISGAQVSNFESGKNEPNDKVKKYFLDKYDIDLDLFKEYKDAWLKATGQVMKNKALRLVRKQMGIL